MSEDKSIMRAALELFRDMLFFMAAAFSVWALIAVYQSIYYGG